MLKAGFWDRSSGDGCGFAAGGVADDLPPGPALAGLAGAVWAAGLSRVSDDELIGVLRAARRLASWAGAMELAAVGDLWRRRLADEAGGDADAAEHAGDEVAAALRLTGRAADTVLSLAVDLLRRLPATAAALSAGDIDMPRATAIAHELSALSDTDAAAVERLIIGAAPGQTTGELRQAARRAVYAADPAAARRRKEQAQRQARVERWSEPAGTATLAGRDLPPVTVLAADQNLTALARQLKDAGCAGTMDTLRASVYLALLTGTPLSQLLPRDLVVADPGAPVGATPAGSSPVGQTRDRAADGRAGTALVGLAGGEIPAGLAVKGTVNLTLPLATWLGRAQAPGHAAGFGALDATDARALAQALAAQRGTKWCLTLTDPDGHPLLHGCTHTAPPGPQPPGPQPPGKGRSATGPPATGPPGTGPPGTGPPDPGPPSAAPTAQQPPDDRLPSTGTPGAGTPGTGPPDPRPPSAAPTAQQPPDDRLPSTGTPGAGTPGTPPPGTGSPGNEPARDEPEPPGAGTPGTGLPGAQPPRAEPPGAGTSCISPPPNSGPPGAQSPGTQPPDPGRSGTGALPTSSAGTRLRSARGSGGTDPAPASGQARPQTGTGSPSRRGDGKQRWTVTLTRLSGSDCDHTSQTAGYAPGPALRHLVQVRQPTCCFPGCRRPGIRTDLDHTIAYHLGGRTCLCNLGPLCRHHHQLKQALGWTLEQTSPGIMTWTTPSGRRYTVQHQCPA